MKKTTYKYIISVDTSAWDNTIEEVIDKKSTYREIEVLNEDPLLARKNAFEQAKSIESYFEDKNEAHIFPPIKWLESFPDKEPSFWMYYQIKINFVINSKSYCVFNSGEVGAFEDELFNGLQNEYIILKKAKIKFGSITELVKYYDCNDKKNKQAIILTNDMDWSDFRLNSILEIELNGKKKSVKQKKKVVRKISKINSIFKSTYKHRFKNSKDTIEIIINATSRTIPNDLENDINKLIQRWTSK